MAKIVIGKASACCKDSGGYSVQPVPGGPPGTKYVPSSRQNANGKIQKLKLLSRGNAMSGAPTCNGIIQFASPTKLGMTAPKIITRPCVVMSELNSCGSTNCSPGWNSSSRMHMASAPLTSHIAHAKIRYIVP